MRGARRVNVVWQSKLLLAGRRGADAPHGRRMSGSCGATSGASCKREAASLPFAEDLLAAHYCAFDRQTPLHVKAVLIGAIAYFVLPTDLIPTIFR